VRVPLLVTWVVLSLLLSTAAWTPPYRQLEHLSGSSFTPQFEQGGTIPATSDWPQLGYNAQRTNASPVQVDPPYCYIWKWYEATIPSRAQPIVANGRLFVGSVDGIFYGRDAATGAPLWHYVTNNPIRHSAAVWQDVVVFSDHLGSTYGLAVTDGTLRWRQETGSSSTAPLVDTARARIYVASSDGRVSALHADNGALIWQIDLDFPVLTTPSLSEDGTTIFLGTEQIDAIALNAADGVVLWRTRLQGQSLAERYPVVLGDNVYYRSQPLDFFHLLLQEGDRVMDEAGPLLSDWDADWALVRGEIVSFLTSQPSRQTFFALNGRNGALQGVAPVLYTYGLNDVAAPPVVHNNTLYLAYRARHGIQTDGNAVHVSTKYDAELGRMDPTTLDITGLKQVNFPTYNAEFRMTSDENAVLTLSGDLLLVDNWERLGGIDLASRELVSVGNVSNDWPECGPWIPGEPNTIQCGPAGANPFFPLSGRAEDAAYPFPSPRITEGGIRGGAIAAQGMLFWRVIAGGLAGIASQEGGNCPSPLVYTETAGADVTSLPTPPPVAVTRSLTDYIEDDLTTPVPFPPADLTARLNDEIQTLVATNEHLMPLYLQRGFSVSSVWPPDTANPPGPPVIGHQSAGNTYWHDPGELIYTLALAYPYLNADLKAQVYDYVVSALARYSPLENLPWSNAARDWLRSGAARESYDVHLRTELNAWPPPAPSLSSLYAIWLWSKNSGDWSYATEHWPQAKSLFSSRRQTVTDYYANLAGVIGYLRIAQHLGDTAAVTEAEQVALSALEDGKDFARYAQFAAEAYLDPRGYSTGLSMPVFWGLTPEVGRYLREQTQGEAIAYITAKEESDDGLRWWYLTRAGIHGEVGETSFLAPTSAWSHFLAHAYIRKTDQEQLRLWLDRPWGRGDLYSIQKIVATLHAEPREALVLHRLYAPVISR
jgi:outer membrane protein assembly factor BamB